MTHGGVSVRSRISHTWKTKNLFLPPATKLRQGNVFTPVCHSVHRESVYQPPLGRHPWADTPQADTPWADTPAPLPSGCWDTHTPGQTSPSDQTPPLGRHTLLGRHPLDTLPWADISCPVHAGIHTPCPLHAGIHPPAQCTLGHGQQAGDTHPTGMQTCWQDFCWKLHGNERNWTGGRSVPVLPWIRHSYLLNM